MGNSKKISTRECIDCGSKNVRVIYEGSEIATYKCLDCKTKYGFSSLTGLLDLMKRKVMSYKKK